MWSIIAASVVDLPEPVGPVTSTRPRGRSARYLQTFGRLQVLHRRDLQRDDAEDGAHRVALLEDVRAEARHARDAVGEVELEFGLEARALLLGEQVEDHLLRVLRREQRLRPRSATISPRSRMPGGLPTVMCRSEPPRSIISPEQVVDVRDVLAARRASPRPPTGRAGGRMPCAGGRAPTGRGVPGSGLGAATGAGAAGRRRTPGT